MFRRGAALDGQLSKAVHMTIVQSTFTMLITEAAQVPRGRSRTRPGLFSASTSFKYRVCHA